jgi:BASS family bile acid:Na+ symporter
LKNLRFTLVIVAAVVISLNFPTWFISVGGFPLKKLIIPLLQVIMFGMGTTIGWSDFANIVKMPGAVLIGLACQFIFMPAIGFILAGIFDFPPEIAAGIILIGCSPSGLASNVMAYLAKANVPLSITITSCATIMAPLMTPLLMRWLGGQYISISVTSMMLDILQMIIIPIVIGLAVHHYLPRLVERLKNWLPVVSMAGIALIIVIITASGRQALLTIGFTLLIAVILHNLMGYTLGYLGAKLFRLPEKDCRTIAIEVGLQNAGLASGLALSIGREGTVGLAAALFGPVMNTTGSLLASWWGRQPPESPEKPGGGRK